MTAAEALRRALDALERTQQALGDIPSRDDHARSQEMVARRRDLAHHLAAVGEQGDALFGRHDADTARAFRRHFNAMRTGIAHLQANWPAVKARDDTSGDYARAVAEARRIDAGCVAWIRAALTELEQGTKR